jgi:hypothetical protein
MMTRQRSVLLILLAGAISLPFAMSACGSWTDKSESREEANKDDDSTDKGQKASTDDFRLPDDPGGRLVLRVLAPTEKLPALDRHRQRSHPVPRSLVHPALPLTPQEVSLPRLPETSLLRTPPPQLVPPEPLFGLEESFGSLPQLLSFPAMDRVRVPSADVNQPVTLPRSAQPVVEKPSFTDPTLDASKSAILSATLPSRETPVPFARESLPDPFENHDTVRLTGMPVGEHLPDGTIRPPR